MRVEQRDAQLNQLSVSLSHRNLQFRQFAAEQVHFFRETGHILSYFRHFAATREFVLLRHFVHILPRKLLHELLERAVDHRLHVWRWLLLLHGRRCRADSTRREFSPI